ncbi:MAG: tRNA (adenosine(37)-N6)-threonylcarbamoyltransferase complex dimerization subunit type 1 TsaB [Acidobacteriota bacterium]|nr:tRNA (adenosine(37)-N6)-threonylcarbamoyltransferase complex dimerization subunit type 1 TsaB [Acidobacteriota bacterium]
MLILGIDTSGKSGGIALARADAGAFTLLEAAPIAGGTFSSQLIPLVAELLTKHKLKQEDIGGFAVASGPGSFTGLRVGLAAVKGLAEVLGKPIAAVSVLEALAILATAKTEQAPSLPDGKVAAALDAQRQEVYLGEYEVVQGVARTLREELLSRPGLIAHLRGDSKPAGPVVTPDDAVARHLREAGIACIAVARPGATEIARIGGAKLARGETISVEQLDANYLRNTDAQIFAKPETSKKK